MNKIQLTDVIFVDDEYSLKYPHMIHRHENFLELLYIAAESGRYIVGNYEYAVTAGDFVICNATIPHGEDPFQEHCIQTYCLVFSGVKLDNLPTGHMVAENQRPILSLGKENFVANLLPDIYKMFHGKKNYYEVCRHLAMGIFFMLREKIAERDKNLKPTKQKRERLMYRIMDYINEHYAEPLTLKKISEAVYISEAHLSHYFKKDAGLSPMQYMMQRRIGEAQSKLIETSQPIQDIGEELGFVSSAHFSKMFKKYVGITPKEYRSHFSGRRERK
ncbi:MAG: helix-turn-helix transcriptional regulator [Selenomonadaceae bacterium]|nr:helix-turn-helix transcriptional regulator [Selenomonadaceae bacterium]